VSDHPAHACVAACLLEVTAEDALEEDKVILGHGERIAFKDLHARQASHYATSSIFATAASIACFHASAAWIIRATSP